MLCDEMVLESGADILFHTMIADVDETENGVDLSICTKTGLKKIQARIVVDCTGDANVINLANYPLNIYIDDVQPGTLTCIVSGYNPQNVDYDQLNKVFIKAVENGELQYSDAGWNLDNPKLNQWVNYRGVNANHINRINAFNSEGKTHMELEGRKSVLRMFRFLKKQPGFESIKIDFMASECGVRETATIKGESTITLDDYYYGKKWDDAICYSFFPIDLHTSDGSGLEFRQLPKNTIPTIPRSAMLPANSHNLVAAGRIISSDRLANSALRVQASCMATGQAAGAMAAMAAKQELAVNKLDIDEIRTVLKKHKAIIPR